MEVSKMFTDRLLFN